MATMTPARRKALELLGSPAASDGVNVGADGIAKAAADWLAAEGYATAVASIDGRKVGKLLTITQAGRDAYADVFGGGASGAGSAPDSPGDGLDAFAAPDGPDAQDGPSDGVSRLDAAIAYTDARLEFEGHPTPDVVTRLTGIAKRYTGPIHHGERGIAVIEWECTGVAFPRTADGVRRVHSLTVLDVLAHDNRSLLNDLKLANDPSPLPFKSAADAATFGTGDASAPVLVIFAGGARAAWPDDFPEASIAARPMPGESLEVPGAKAPDNWDTVVELLDLVDGRRIAILDDEDHVGDRNPGAGEED